MDNQIPFNVRKQRAAIVRKISSTSKLKYRESLLGSIQEVLVEKIHRDTSGKFGLRDLFSLCSSAF